jgi:tetratricopeptide (TPR) repeat protein
MQKRLLFILPMLFFTALAIAQVSQPPSGENYPAEVSQWIGIVKVTINYSSPDVHGPQGEDRKGKIWGELVHYGFIDQGFGTSKAAPWRAGANENTTITFSHDVKIGGKDVKAGTYGLLLDVEKEGSSNWIISKDANSWGSYYYNPDFDVVRVPTTLKDCEYTEWLTYSFDNRQRNTATVYIQWENKRADFKIDVPNINELYVAKMKEELRGTMASFRHEPYIEAASFCLQNNVELEQGLKWADYAINDGFVGREDFNSLSLKGLLLTALKRESEADAIMEKAIKHPSATVGAIHQYARTLLQAGRKEKAMEVFKYNYKTHPEDKFVPNVGLARGYTAIGDKKNAIKHWEAAIKNLPEARKQELPFYEAELKRLKG